MMATADPAPLETRPYRYIQYRSIDAWRGIAALAVVVCHAVDHLIDDPAQHAHAVAAYKYTLLGQLGVQLFFVVSGFCIASAAVRALDRPDAAWGFVKARVRRIYPPYYIATLLTVAASLLAGALVRHHVLASSVSAGVNITHRSPGFYLATLLLTQLPMRYELLMVVSWTLCYEVSFYALFALLIVAQRRWPLRLPMLDAMSLLSIAAILVGFAVHPPRTPFPLDLLPQFGLGVCVFRQLQEPASRRALGFTLTTLALLAAYGALVDWNYHGTHVSTRLQSFCCVAFAALLLALHPRDARLMSNKLVQLLAWVGTFSYTLYLTHELLLGFSEQLARKAHLTTLPFWPQIAAQAVIATLGARLLYRVMEQPFLSPARTQVNRVEQRAVALHAPDPAPTPTPTGTGL